MVLRRAFLAGAALVLAAPALAADPPYLTARQLDLSIMLPPPPAPGSALQAQEVQQVVAVQHAASPERIKQAQADAEETVWAMFTPTLGDRFSAEKLPKAAAFFQRVTDSEDEVVDPAKKVFGRKRPFQASADVQKIEPASSSGSWPSGHTTRVTMCAIILAAMLPEQREAIWARAADYAQSRIVLGMHYPLDLEAGQRAGTAMAALMFAGPSFPMDYEAAKAEVRTALAP